MPGLGVGAKCQASVAHELSSPRSPPCSLEVLRADTRLEATLLQALCWVLLSCFLCNPRRRLTCSLC